MNQIDDVVEREEKTEDNKWLTRAEFERRITREKFGMAFSFLLVYWLNHLQMGFVAVRTDASTITPRSDWATIQAAGLLSWTVITVGLFLCVVHNACKRDE